jgi:Putative transposase/Transposase zinc-binding domain
LAFSCRTRNFCSSCQAKRAALFAEKLATEILPPGAYRHWTFTIPKAIRGLFERERRLLGLLSRTAYEAVRRSFEALFDRKDLRPGCVISIQTFGSYGANFNPHCHAIISDGVWSDEGEFLELPSLDTAAVCELFRRLLLRRLHKEERLSQRFMENLLSWVHPGFSVFAGEPFSPQDPEQLDRLARYITRPPLAADSIRRRHDGMLEIATPPDPRTGSTLRLFDPLDWIHAVTAHIPDRGRHCVRYYGAVANRAQSPKISKQQTPPAADPGASVQTPPEFVQRRRASWARLIKKIFEVDPLLCTCGAEMKIVSFITDTRVVDRILRHLKSQACRAQDPFEPRAPPEAGGNILH